MKESAQIEAMARLEFGCEGVTGGVVWTVVADNNGEPEQEPIADCPDYLHDHNAVQKVIDGLDPVLMETYIFRLAEVMKINSITEEYHTYIDSDVATATCAQKTEATLKACGKWEDK